MTIYLVVSIITLLFISVLGLHVYFSNRRQALNQEFAFLIFSCFVWVLANFLSDIFGNENFCLFWKRFSFVGGALIAYSFYRFTLVFPRVKKYKFNHGYVILAMTIVFIVLSPTKWTVPDIYFENGFCQMATGLLVFPFLIYFSLAILVAVFNLTRGYVTYSKIEKSQVKLVLTGALIAVAFGVTGDLILPLLGRPGIVILGLYGLLFFFVFTYYAILKHRLFNIRVAIGKIVVYCLYFATALVVGLLIAFLNSRLAQPLPITIVAPFIALAAVILFQLLGYYHKIAHYFYPTFRNTEMTIAKLEEKLTEVLETDTMASLLTTTLKQAFDLQKLAILVKNLQGPLLVKNNIGFSQPTLDSFAKAIEPSMIPILQKIKKPFGAEEVIALSNRVKPIQIADLQQLAQLLQTNQINVVVPLWFRKRLVGLIVLGEKANQNPFTTEDFQLLAALSYQTSIALHNANLYSEVKKRKEELERFYRLTVGREMKMVELKKKNLELEQRLREK